MLGHGRLVIFSGFKHSFEWTFSGVIWCDDNEVVNGSIGSAPEFQKILKIGDNSFLRTN